MNKTSTDKNLFDSLGSLFGLVGGLSLACSLVYDWGFYNAAGLTFNDIPSTITDHLRSSLVWLPKAAISLAGLIIIELALKRLEHGLTEEEIIQSSKNPERTRKIRNSPTKMIYVVILLMVATYILFGSRFNFNLQLPLICFWFIFSGWINSHPRIQERRSESLRLIIHWVPPILIFLFFMGQNSFNSIVDSKPQHLIYIANSAENTIEGSVLRNLENGALIYHHESKTFQFIEWSNIAKIQHQYNKTYFRGVLAKFSPKFDTFYEELENSKPAEK